MLFTSLLLVYGRKLSVRSIWSMFLHPNGGIEPHSLYRSRPFSAAFVVAFPPWSYLSSAGSCRFPLCYCRTIILALSDRDSFSYLSSIVVCARCCLSLTNAQ